MQNLEKTVSFLNLDPDDKVEFRGSQTDNICWSSPESFVPINNPTLEIYNGNRFTITDLKIKKHNDGYAGLFGNFTRSNETEKSELKNIYLCNPHIELETETEVEAETKEEAKAARATGVLAGKAENSEISGCQVYINKEDNEPNEKYGDFVLKAESGYVGGLLGESINCTVKNSSASVPEIIISDITSNDAAGGLIGYVDGGTVTACYSDTGYYTGSIDSSGDSFKGGIAAPGSALKSGGLVGLAARGAVFNDCYALGKFSSPPESVSAGFLLAEDNSVKASRCYSVILEGSVTYGFADSGDYSDCFYYSSTEPDNAPHSGIIQKSYDDMTSCFSKGWWSISTDDMTPTYPYGNTGNYPFPVLYRLPHYGDWPEKKADEAAEFWGLVYYEKYSDDTYGLYGYNKNNEFKTTLNNDNIISSTGYGIFFSKDELTKYNIIVDHSSNWTETLEISTNVNISIGKDYLYPFNDEQINVLSKNLTSKLLNSIVITSKNSSTSKNYNLNVLFGATVELKLPDQPEILGTEAKPLQLRTPEHFSNLALPNSVVIAYFKQTRDINMEEWESVSIIMNENSVIDGNGENHKISQLSKPLFNNIAQPTSLQNFNIENADIQLTGNSNYGILVNTARGPIINCKISNSTINVTNGNASGLAGILNGTLTLENNYLFNCDIISDKNASGLVCGDSNAYATVERNYLEQCRITSSGESASGLMYASHDNFTIDDNHLTNCTIIGKGEAEAVGLIKKFKGKMGGKKVCDIKDSYIESEKGNASGFVSDTQYTISSGGIYNSIIQAHNGSAVGIIQTYGNDSDCSLSGIIVENCQITGKNAAGFADINRGFINNCTVNCSDKNMVFNEVLGILEPCGIYGTDKAAGFIDTNSGDNSNAAIQGSHAICTVEGVEAAGFVRENGSNRRIENCYAECTVKGDTATGFISTIQQGGQISQCYTNCTVNGNIAAGFVIETKSPISNCYVVGGIHGTSKAAGFMINNLATSYGKHTYCYTAANVKADTNDSYAFAPKDNKEDYFSECYYLAPPDFTDVKSVGNPVIYGNLTITGLGWVGPGLNSIWEQKKATQESPNPYPFPQLKNLPHEGSWPLPPS